jgi:hypothetical protein
MNPDHANLMLDPIVQCGFAGMCAILLAIVVWLISQLLKVIRDNNTVIARNNELVSGVIQQLGRQEEQHATIARHLAERPCLWGRPPGVGTATKV